jgi:hypothetical protein
MITSYWSRPTSDAILILKSIFLVPLSRYVKKPQLSPFKYIKMLKFKHCKIQNKNKNKLVITRREIHFLSSQ